MTASYLVFDTNALPVKGNLESGFWTALFHLCSMKGIRPAISEVTLHEAVNFREDQANKLITPLVATHSELSRMTRMDPVYTPTAADIAAVYEARLNELFEVLPLEGDHAIEALRREARRVVPARLGKGGRDSAIWLTIAALANQGHTVRFVTNNHKDFGRGGLFTELLEETTHPIIYLPTANEFVDEIATKIATPSLEPEDVANSFSLSIRSLVINMLEQVDSAEHTVDRAWNAEIAMEDVVTGQAYDVDGQGLVYVRANTRLVDPSGVEWATGKLSGWLNFEPATSSGQPSEVDTLLELDFR